MFEIRTEKNRLREKYKKIREDLTDSEKSKLDTKIVNRFLSLVSYRFADTLLMYSPIKGEIDVMPIAEAALAAGKKVAFPRCFGQRNEMSFHYVSSLDELKRGSFSILEPQPDAALFKPESVKIRESCVCLIPALAYDKSGYRIGYGKGYYDRYLSHFNGIKAGIVYHRCIADSLVHGRFDLTADFIISERGVTIIK